MQVFWEISIIPLSLWSAAFSEPQNSELNLNSRTKNEVQTAAPPSFFNSLELEYKVKNLLQ